MAKGKSSEKAASQRDAAYSSAIENAVEAERARIGKAHSVLCCVVVALSCRRELAADEPKIEDCDLAQTVALATALLRDALENLDSAALLRLQNTAP